MISLLELAYGAVVMVGSTYVVANRRSRLHGQLVTVIGRGSWRREFKDSPRNVLIEAADGTRDVIPFRGWLRRPTIRTMQAL